MIHQDDRSLNHHVSSVFQVGVIQINEIDKLSPAMREIAENEINLLLKVSLFNGHAFVEFMKHILNTRLSNAPFLLRTDLLFYCSCLLLLPDACYFL